jgi:hypothetical protein
MRSNRIGVGCGLKVGTVGLLMSCRSLFRGVEDALNWEGLIGPIRCGRFYLVENSRRYRFASNTMKTKHLHG